jgi:hypothetical protein
MVVLGPGVLGVIDEGVHDDVDGGVPGARKIWRKMRSCVIRCAFSREKEAERELKQTGTVAMRSKSSSVMLTTSV